MARLVALAVVLCAAGACGGGSRAGTPSPPHAARGLGLATHEAPPALRLPPDVVPRGYVLELGLDPRQGSFTGDARIDVALAAPRRLIWLNATALAVTSATVTQAGVVHRARTIAVGRELIAVQVDVPLAVGPATIELAYTGPLPGDVNEGIYRVEERGAWAIYTQFEAIHARRAFPSFDDPAHKVPVALALRVPEGMIAVANTPIVSETPLAGGGRRVVFAPTRPIPTYLVAFAVGVFDVVELGPLGTSRTPTRVIVPKGRGGEVGYVAEAMPRVFELVEGWFGTPHPYPKLDLVAVPRMGGAMENAGLITFGLPILVVPPDELTVLRRRAIVVYAIHELAHQWFGNLVTAAWWDDLWLNEALATWLEEKLTIEFEPRWGTALEAVQARADVMDEDAQASARRIREPIVRQDDIEDAFDSITYAKGQAVLAMLEAWLGDETFQRGVRRYLATHADGNATTSDFVRALSHEAGRDVGGVLGTFVDQQGVPLIDVGLACAPGRPPTLRLAQRRYRPQGAGGPDTGATWRLPVCVRYDRRAAPPGRACTLLEGPTAEAPLADAAACPRWVVPNAGMLGYYHSRLDDDLLTRTLAAAEPSGARGPTEGERIGLVLDLAALAHAGLVPITRALAPLAGLARSPHRATLETAVALAELIPDEHVPEALRPARAAWLRGLFGTRARRLGLLARPGEPDDDRVLRPLLVDLVAVEGEDPVLADQAARLVVQWVRDPDALPMDRLGQILEIAAARGDRALYDTIFARARAEGDRVRRGRLIAALGDFRDPAIVDVALAQLLDDALVTQESLRILWGVLGDRRTRARGWAFLERHLDAIAARLPREHEASLLGAAAGFCDVEDRARAAKLLSEPAARWVGGARAYAQLMEAVDLCVATRGAHRTEIERFLGAPGAGLTR